MSVIKRGNPRKKAVRNFVSVVGNKPMNEITADDMLQFRSDWQDWIGTGGLTAKIANRGLIHLGEVLKTVNKIKRLGVGLPLDGLAFKEGETSERPPFSDDWIRTKRWRPEALMTLNPEALAIFLGMINTGYRPS